MDLARIQEKNETMESGKFLMTDGFFVSGGTGYVGQALTALLLAKRNRVRVLVRPGSEHKTPRGADVVLGDALRADSFRDKLHPGDTLVHLTGVAHPAPWKGAQFRAVDLVSLRASAEAAVAAGVGHFVYVSVAHPAPVMRAYIEVRRECEAILAATGLRRTILRPWYVLGPGHRWPLALRPVYALLEALPATREGARRLGLVTLEQMVGALAWAVENPPESVRVVEVPEIRGEGR
jgi:uncharacterized protein YbjT (DUF2867 family)